jgi:glycine/D-amino acid oxidase-like deaminating enzyme
MHIKSSPPWDEGVPVTHFPPLAESIEADVVIIGGGITGLTAAYLLSHSKLKIVLIEKDRLAYGATGLTTAFLTSYLDTHLRDLIGMYGEKTTKAIIKSHAAAIDRVENIVQQEKLECEFKRCSNYVYATSASAYKDLHAEKRAADKLGIKMRWGKSAQLPFPQSGYLELPQQAKFHPKKYLAGLVTILQQRGVHIYEKTEARSLQENGKVVVDTPRGRVVSPKALVATYAPFNKKLFFKKAFYTSYVFELAVPRQALPEGIYEDTENPYHYFRVDRGKERDRVIFGGEDHRSDIPVKSSKNFAGLKKHLAETFSSVPYTLIRQWQGPIIEPVDGLAFIGPAGSSTTMYATGFSGNGMTYATIAALMFANMVQGKKHQGSRLYDAARIPTFRSLLYKGRDYTQELIGGAVRNTITAGQKES